MTLFETLQVLTVAFQALTGILAVVLVWVLLRSGRRP